MKINHEHKTVTFGTFELVAAINYVERCVTKGERTTWRLVPELTVTKKADTAIEPAQNRR